MSGLAPIIEIPKIENIDFLIPEEANIYAFLLCLAAREATKHIPAGNLSSITRLRQNSKKWINEIEAIIDRYPAAEALQIAHSYDFIHRLAYNAPPCPTIINHQVFRALDEVIKKGNIKGQSDDNKKEIDPYLLFRFITAGLNRKDPSYLGRPLKWQSLKLTRWYREFKAEVSRKKSVLTDNSNISNNSNLSNNYNNSNLSDRYDNSNLSYNPGLINKINRLSILLESDLTAFEGRNQATFKQHLFLTHRQLLDLIPSRISSNLTHFQELGYNALLSILLSLRAIEHLLFLSIPYLSEEEYHQKKTALNTLLSNTLTKRFVEGNTIKMSIEGCRR